MSEEEINDVDDRPLSMTNLAMLAGAGMVIWAACMLICAATTFVVLFALGYVQL
jgi:hypothetical protein